MNKQSLISIILLGMVFLGLSIYDNHPETISDNIFGILGIVVLGFIPFYYFQLNKSESGRK